MKFQLKRSGIFESDLDEIILSVGSHWAEITNTRIVIFGGTGFIGKWLTSALLEANDRFNLNLKIILYVRDPSRAFEGLNLDPRDPVEFIKVDFSSGSPISLVESDFIVHAATPTSINRNSGIDVYSAPTIGAATSILQASLVAKKSLRIVHLSSGSVYGPLNNNLNQFYESQVIYEDDVRDHYTKAKVSAENIIKRCSENTLVKFANPRLFTFAGPHLPLDKHFAVGNFILNGRNKESIVVKGNPNSVRSYMYPTELISNLIFIMLDPQDIPINVGSETCVTIEELAHKVNRFFPQSKVVLANKNDVISKYWPSTSNLRENYGFVFQHSIDEMLERWINWLEKIT